jgi:hypothetical protein
MKYFFFLSIFFLFSSCSPCYTCGFQYYLNAEDQKNNTNIVIFTTNKNCSVNFENDMEDLFFSKPFRVEGSFNCKKLKG